MKNEKFTVTGMSCAACQANIERNVGKLDGVCSVNVNLLANSMTVEYDEGKMSGDKIIDTVISIGYGAESENDKPSKSKDKIRTEWEKRRSADEEERRRMKRRLVSSVILLVILMYVAMAPMLGLPMLSVFKGEENVLVFTLTQLFLAVPIIIINSRFYTSGFKALVKRSPNMDSLVAIGSMAALVYGVIAIYVMAYGMGHGDRELVHRYMHSLYFESAAMILTLVTVGKYLEARSKSKTSDALGRLVDLAPKTASVIRNGEEVMIPAEQVAAGDIVVIRPAEALPVDGVIIEGNGYIDQSAITGESIPVSKTVGDSVISATTNKNGSFKYRASRVGSDTTLAQIIRLVDEAGSTKAPIARVADKVSGIFVPTVICIALITAVVWLAAGYGAEFAVTNAISVLVISCPCALGLAAPVAIMVGTGKAAEYGILIKSAESLENLHSMDTIVLDKTGTVTEGKPKVTDVIVLDRSITKNEFIKMSAAVEYGSEHPLAQAVIERAKGMDIPKAEGFKAYSGRGVSAKVGEDAYIAGNLAFIKENGVSDDIVKPVVDKLSAESKTALVFCKGNKPVGVMAVADTIRADSAEAIENLHKMGFEVIMLTGDNAVTARAIGEKLNIKKTISEVMPADKEKCIRELQEKGHKVIMVGDGINDAPALSRADIGAAIGAGTDIAIDSADIVLMKNSLSDVVTAVELSRKVIRNIYMNLFWAFFYNILGIPLAAGVLFPIWGIRLSPMIGSAAMSLSSVCVVSNALRLRFFRPRHKNENAGAEIEIKTSEEELSMKKVMKVNGMMCAHCKAHVENALLGIAGISAVEADVESGTVEITLTEYVNDKLLMNTVTEAGYEAVSCEDM